MPWRTVGTTWLVCPQSHRSVRAEVQADLQCSQHSGLPRSVITMTWPFPDEETGHREELSCLPEVMQLMRDRARI